MKLLCLVASLAGAALGYSPQYAGEAWQSKPAVEKVMELSNRIQADASTPGWYSAQLAELFVEGMDKTFSSSMDDMPAQNLFNLEERPKLIHSVGAVAHMQFKPEASKYNYTGVFYSGCTGFARLSLAKQPDGTPGPKSLVAPGLALKFMRDGYPSATVLAMYSLLGQKSYNFFEHDLSNHVPDIDIAQADFALQQLYKVFKSVSDYPTMLGLSDMASYDCNGNTYSEPRFPYRLIFHPTSRVRSRIPSTQISGNDYFIQQLSDDFFVGELYEVYAQPLPTSTESDYEKIGTITLTGKPSGSRWGDHDMFLQHYKFENDLKQHPEWKKGTDANTKHQRDNFPFAFPDLPFN